MISALSLPPPRPPGLNGANVSSHIHEGDRDVDEGMHEQTVCAAREVEAQSMRACKFMRMRVEGWKLEGTCIRWGFMRMN